MTDRMPDETLHDLADEFLVECPRCDGAARVAAHGADGTVRLSCPGCGLVREKESGAMLLGEPVDAYFGLSLWLRTACCGEELWALNARHLTVLEGIVASGDRRAPAREDGVRNALLASRLPRWMLLAHRREEVLAGLRRLREKLPGRSA